MSEELAPRFEALPLRAVKPEGWILKQLNRDLQQGFASRLDHLTAYASNDMFQDRVDTSTNTYAWWGSELWAYQMTGEADMKSAIDQETHYPFSESVTLIVRPERDLAFALYLRKPAWSADTPVQLDAESIHLVPRAAPSCAGPRSR